VRVLEPLGTSHDRESFDCGSGPLNLFLKQTAGQHGKRGISKTFVLVEEKAAAPKPILRFFALNVCQIRSSDLTPEESKKLPREVAAVRLGRLAVSIDQQRQGIGKLLLVAAMEKFLEIHQAAGGIGLFVDAKDQAAKEYYEQFGFIPMPSNELALFLPVRTIQEALGAREQP
jgi:ribosomal protein S18 acetylase RimI-like enzyme